MTNRTPRPSGLRQMGTILVVGIAARVAVLWILPPNAMSYDLRAWRSIVRFLAEGQNPYNVPQRFLSWPPAWMQIVFVLGSVARRLDVPVTVAIRVFLILSDALGALLAGRMIRRLGGTSVVLPMLLGWALNPAAILLVCQHANFDGLIAICVLLTLLSLIAFNERQESISWLWSCAWLGAGVVLKTIPLALTPLLATGRDLPRKVLALGAALVAAPALYGLSVVYVLGPASVRERVLGYQGIPGLFGISGLLTIAGKQSWMPAYRILFALLLIAGMAWLAVHVRRSSTPRALVFAAVMILLAIPAIGPGYGNQYLAWSLPLLIVVWSIGERSTRAVVSVFGCAATLTYLVDYALIRTHGAFLMPEAEPSLLTGLSNLLATPFGATMERLPLFLAYLVLLAHLGVVTRRELGQRSPSLVRARA